MKERGEVFMTNNDKNVFVKKVGVFTPENKATFYNAYSEFLAV